MTGTSEDRESPEVPGYTIVKKLGAGRLSSVYLATQTSLERPVAIKILDAASGADSERFDREADIMAGFSHPHLVSVFDRGKTAHVNYIAMEYLTGGNLASQLETGKPLDLWTITKVLNALSAALSAVHACGLIHRDVKPGNILFGDGGQIKLCDFGISVPLDEQGQLTEEDTAPGTLDYMAPEQRYRLDVDTRADQYSLAVVAYEMLTGTLPGRMFVNPSDKDPRLNPFIDSVFERALQEEPDARFPAVCDFVHALTSALEQLSGTQSPEPTRPGRMAVPVAIVAAVALLYTVMVALGNRDDGGELDPETEVVQNDDRQFTSDQVPPGADANLQTIEQTGALIYRTRDDGVMEICLVRARSGNHWTIPKANQISTVGVSSVAEEEAFEEAGVKGTAVPDVIGTYEYERAKRSHRVSVLAVECDQELEAWPEAHFRERKWIIMSGVGRMIASDDLRDIIKSFRPDGIDHSDKETRP